MDKEKKYDLSFIIPCYRSENTIRSVIDEITETVSKLSLGLYEIIAIDDCSPDNVYDVLKEMAASDDRIKAIRFAKNFGQHAGMIAGVQYSSGDICVYLDDDGQCPIDHLKELIDPLYKGYDVSIAEYGRKKQSHFKNMGSRFNELVANLLIDKPKDIRTGNYMAFRRFVADEISKYRGPYPYISGLLFRSSSKVINVPMEERERMEGGTTYTLKKLIALWSNSFTAFSVKPLRLATFVGCFTAFVGIVLVIVTIVRRFINPEIPVGWSSTIATMLVLGGMILVVLGIIGEYIGRIYMSINETPQYVISDMENI